MRGDYGIYLNFVNGNHYQAVFGVAQRMPTIPVPNLMPCFPVLQSMPTNSSLPTVVPNLLSKYISNVAVTSSMGAMSSSKLATVFSSTSFNPSQKRPRGRPPKNPRICYTYLLYFLLQLYFSYFILLYNSCYLQCFLANVTLPTNSVSLAKRGRGRPRHVSRIFLTL